VARGAEVASGRRGGAGGKSTEEKCCDAAGDARLRRSAAMEEVTGSWAKQANWLGGSGGFGLAQEKKIIRALGSLGQN
jgi:hypothetical protein